MSDTEEDDVAFARLFRKIEGRCGFRGAHYRKRSLRRRVGIRMRAAGVEGPAAYAALLDRDPEECERLLRVLTINVSRFFRDPETWARIRDVVLPDLVEGRAGLTVWSAGAARGEEAYTAAILIEELLRDRGRSWPSGFRVIGTDIDEGSLRAARAGRYPEAAVADVPLHLRERWFEGGPPFRVKPPLPYRVDFRVLDLLAGRPDFDADLILLRNVLIYLEREAQRRVFETCLEVLRPGGYLVLGRVETLRSRARDRMEVVDARDRIYRRAP